jgi:UDP-N-acetylglucosamine transferase subunit ALG13
LAKVSIFLTVGSQLPFDRLVDFGERLEELFPERYSFFYQTCSKEKKLKRGNSAAFLTADQFTQKVEESDIVVTHAGIGSIITSFLHSKYVIVVPREFKYGEHRNDHQLDTARELNNVAVVRDFDGFLNAIEAFNSSNSSFEVFNAQFYSDLEKVITKYTN